MLPPHPSPILPHSLPHICCTSPPSCPTYNPHSPPVLQLPLTCRTRVRLWGPSWGPSSCPTASVTQCSGRGPSPARYRPTSVDGKEGGRQRGMWGRAYGAVRGYLWVMYRAAVRLCMVHLRGRYRAAVGQPIGWLWDIYGAGVGQCGAVLMVVLMGKLRGCYGALMGQLWVSDIAFTEQL